MSALLSIDDLHVYYASAHVLQGVSFEHDGGVLCLLGRNGMGKTTLARSIMGLVPVSDGEVRVRGDAVTNHAPHRVAARGVGYVPQGRDIYPSLTVDEHLRMLAGRTEGEWTMPRVYELFPRLEERRTVHAGHLSGGEQQMLAIARALMTNPSLMIMDEPSEGLAPVIVEPLIEKLRTLAASGMAILLIEQNLRMATAVADELLIMVSGRLEARIPPRELEADSALQQQLLGVTMND
ncbi:High-affinity branched-chain amino acid transport ATP-binding protein LivF [wastewater metagenome]|uniref:High-affinity branched-chain amino acid transport ATP-binding protein LivF n=2 Tax=unclassified sequences TaxID=12908 RepID=A0A5B8REA3_9ZZZZ|nr:ABC transporter ATP-binding protein [Arhodomonas aquaeolei]MCS4505854.1 ABC transporter ATP-binding protein [Arhodomonas aquaeolei]QEA07190.1 high-affinity branched-chain amino acid transport ATP-binding protein LivF [uncultured organism]